MAVCRIIGTDRDAKEASNTEFNFIKANRNRISGTLIKVDKLANTLQVCLDSGAKQVLLPATCMPELAAVPADLSMAFDFILYKSAEEAVIKVLGAN